MSRLSRHRGERKSAKLNGYQNHTSKPQDTAKMTRNHLAGSNFLWRSHAGTKVGHPVRRRDGAHG